MAGQQDRIKVAVNGYGVIGKRVADAVAVQEDMVLVVHMRDGLEALNAVKELMADIGRPRDNLYEVALWEDLVTVRGDEAFYACMVDQATVIPETVDAIRALTAREKDAHASIARTNAGIGIGAKLI